MFNLLLLQSRIPEPGTVPRSHTLEWHKASTTLWLDRLITHCLLNQARCGQTLFALVHFGANACVEQSHSDRNAELNISLLTDEGDLFQKQCVVSDALEPARTEGF